MSRVIAEPTAALRARRAVRSARAMNDKLPIYAVFAEVLLDGKGRVWDGKRWRNVDPREIIAATRRAMLDLLT